MFQNPDRAATLNQAGKDTHTLSIVGIQQTTTMLVQNMSDSQMTNCTIEFWEIWDANSFKVTEIYGYLLLGGMINRYEYVLGHLPIFIS